MGTTGTVQGHDSAVLQKRKEKRWVVYVRPNYVVSDSLGDRTVIAQTLFARLGESSYSYQEMGVAPDILWVEKYVGTSFDDAKLKVIQYAATLGLDNVRLDRVVDLSTVLYPIS